MLEEELVKILQMPSLNKKVVSDFLKKILLYQASLDGITLTEEQVKCFTFVDIFKKNVRQNRYMIASNIGLYIMATGEYQNDSQTIIIIPKKFDFCYFDPKKEVAQIFDIIETALHEYYHLKVDHLKEMRIFNGNYLLEEQLRKLNYTYYVEYHDYFLEEIDANLFAIQTLQDQLKNNPNLLKIVNDLLLIKKRNLIENYQNYDVNAFIERLDLFVARHKRLLTLSPMLRAIYHEDGTKKTLEALIYDKNFRKLPKELQYVFIYERFRENNFDFKDIKDNNLLEMLKQAINYKKEELIKKENTILTIEEMRLLQRQEQKRFFSLAMKKLSNIFNKKNKER